MSPRPFYRWKSFWIWIVLLGFITGTGEDSKYHVTGLTLKLPGLFGLTAFRADRAIFLVTGDAENFYNTGFSRADSEALREVRHAAIRGNFSFR